MPFPTRHFHAYRPLLAEHLPNHYETLSLTPNATPADIKRQFFTLSKLHHPDHNPSDPSASTRFVEISEAYHVLSVPEKRAQYDAQLHGYPTHSHHDRHHQHHHAHGSGQPKGSYSSASFAGGRPASGLNKKRGTFRGPPPSFYKSGGYGKQHAKRTEYAGHSHTSSGGASSSEDSSGATTSSGGAGGFGPGQTGQGKSVPHFDAGRHKATQNQIYEHIYGKRRAQTSESAQAWDKVARGGMIIPFLIVSGIFTVAGVFAHLMRNHDPARGKKRERA